MVEQTAVAILSLPHKLTIEQDYQSLAVENVVNECSCEDHFWVDDVLPKLPAMFINIMSVMPTEQTTVVTTLNSSYKQSQPLSNTT